MPEAERIQKFLANAGYGSRREIEGWIKEGRIRVNGELAKLGDRITGSERISLNGKPLKLTPDIDSELKLIAYNKPAGIICSRKDPEGRPTVFEKLPKLKNGRWVNIGRLDINTMGLILFTNSGSLANNLMHPSSNIEREYAVRVLGSATNQQLQALQQGIELEDGVAAFSSIIDKGGEGANHWYHIVINEGRNREVRRLWESQGLKVSRLIRIRYGSCQMPRNKRTGMWWELNQMEIEALQREAGLEVVQAAHRDQKHTISRRQQAGPVRASRGSRRAKTGRKPHKQ